MYTVHRSASTACEQRSTRPRKYASRSFWTARWPSLTRTSATLSASTAIRRHDPAADANIGRRSGLRSGDVTERVDVPARDGLDATRNCPDPELEGPDLGANVA